MDYIGYINFDSIINRNGTNSIKWDGAKIYGKPDNLLPLWVADTDFEVMEEIYKKIKERIEHKIYGYTFIPDSYYLAVANWFKTFHNFNIDPAWIIYTPGVVNGFSMAIQAFTEKGDGIIIQSPVYPPFRRQVLYNDRRVLDVPLKVENNRWIMDFDILENQMKKGAKLFILCSPHNPVGRVWEYDELKKVAELCLKYNVLIVSDEIHADLIFKNYKHIPVGTISDEVLEITITTTAPNKTFNIAGFMMGNAIIKNSKLRERYKKVLDAAGIHLANIPGIIATEVAYRNGKEWVKKLNQYIEDNYNFVVKYLKDNIPAITTYKMEGTFLMWLNFKNTGLSHKEIEDKIIKEAKLWLNDGKTFGDNGEFHFRFNIGTSRKLLKEALERFKKAFI